jgi:Tol biopolymer transport system component
VDDGLDATLSPGGTLVFVAASGGAIQLWQRRVDDERASPLKDTDGARAPSWSADGQTLLFFAGGRLRALTPATGTIRDLADAPAPGGAAMLDDGTVLFSARANAPLDALRNGTRAAATTLAAGDRAHLWPAPAPGGFVYIAVRDDGRRAMRLVAGGATHELGTTDGHAVVVDGILLHVRGGSLLAQRLDPELGTLAGRATALVTPAATANGRALIAASPRLLLVSAASIRARELRWIDAGSGAAGPPATDRGDYWQVRLAPDDASAAVTLVEPQLRTLDVYAVPLAAGGVTTAVSLALAADSDPVWSPDGQRLLFRSLQDGVPRLFSRVIGRAGADIEPVAAASGAVPTEWRQSGTAEILFHAPAARGDTDLFVSDPATGADRLAVSSPFNDADGRWSPDGRFLAYVSDEFGQPDVFVQAWPAGGRSRVSTAGGTKPRWGRDSRTLYFQRGPDIVRVTVVSGATPAPSAPVPVATVPGLRDFDAAHRTDRLLAIVPAAGAAPEIRALADWQPTIPAAQ